VNEVATAPVPAPPKVQRWGIPDALLGWVAVFLFANLWFVVIVAVTGYADVAADDTELLPLGIVALTQLGLTAGFFFVPWVVTKVKGNGLVADLGVRARWGDLWKGGAWGIVTQLVLLPLIYVPILELTNKTSDDLEGVAKSLTDRANSPVDVVLLVLIVGVMAAVFEEIFYRGLLQRSLLKHGLHPALAIGITSVLFGATHFQLLQLPGLTLAGVVFGILAYRADRLGPAIAAHLTFNMVTVIALLAA
jgi:membrane protease YdiL (CAAX protease family)